MPESAGICQNMRECAKICQNGLCFKYPHCNPLPTLTRGYFYQRLHETESYSLKEHEDVSLKRQNLVFPVVPECI